MKRVLEPTRLLAIGIVIAPIGFVYEVLLAGLPCQDPTPEPQVHWEFHQSVARIFYRAGGGIFLMGLLVAPVLRIRTAIKMRRRRQVGDAPQARQMVGFD